MKKCDNCNKKVVSNPVQAAEGWTLNNYYGISGYFCSNCYNLVSHDAYGTPRHPKDYRVIFVKQQLQRAL